MVLPVVWAVFRDHDLRRDASVHFGTTWENKEGFAGWLVTEKPKKLANIVELFLWIGDIEIGKMGA